jgi:SAM-dependent methyltransferase
MSFHNCLVEEVEYHRNSRKYLSADGYKILRSYYREVGSGNVVGLARWKTRLLSYAVGLLSDRGMAIPRVLDAGCGLGSEAILFGLARADVVGLDISRDRLSVARSRLAYYEDKFRRKLRVRFHAQNLLTYSSSERFDLIWCHQSISHIHPVERFFEIAWANLKKGGNLVICESNKANPYVFFWTWLLHRRQGICIEARDPTTLEAIPYAQERVFNPRELSRFLEQAGYEIASVQYHGFLPRRLLKYKFFGSMSDVIGKIPLLQLVSASYVLGARKAERPV